MSIESVKPHLILCRSLLLLPLNFASVRVFSNESNFHIRWPKYWSFSFSISPSNEYSGLISFGIDWFDFVVQGNLKCILQHSSSKVSSFWHSAFFMVPLSHLYMTTGKTIALTIWPLSAKLCLCFYIGYFCSIFTNLFESLNERSKIQWLSRWVFWNAFFLFFLTSALRDLLAMSTVCFILEIQMDFM